MATAGAATLADACGLPWADAPLLALAVLQALWIAATAVREHRHDPAAWLSLGTADQHTGVHTVPLGLAVIAGGVAQLGAVRIGPWPWVAGACLVLAWLAAIVCIGRCLTSLVRCGLALRAVDGTWFLLPASLLGVAVATVDVARLLPAPSAITFALGWLAWSGAVLGWAGYWAVLAVAAARVSRFGLAGVPRSPWWIAMGCAGLAAAALGRVTASGAAWPSVLRVALVTQVVATAACSVVLCVPIAAYSVHFLCWRCRFRGLVVWIPTFSTAVFALGCLQAGVDLRLSWLRALGLGAGFATLVFWAVTMAWNGYRRGVEVVRPAAA